MAAFRHKRIEINERRNVLRHLVGDARHDHPTIGMAAKNDVVHLLPADEIDDIGNVGAEIDRCGLQVRPVGDAGKRGHINAVTLGREPVIHSAPAPSAMPGPVNEHESLGHRIDPIRCLPAALERLRWTSSPKVGS